MLLRYQDKIKSLIQTLQLFFRENFDSEYNEINLRLQCFLTVSKYSNHNHR